MNKQLRTILILAAIAGLLLGAKLLLIKKEKPAGEIPIFPSLSPSPFAPLSTPTYFLPKGDLDAPLQIQKEIKQDYPLFKYIPHQTQNWKIDYLKPLTLEIIIKKDAPETRSEVLEWIKSKNVEPTTHTIIWKTF